ncbi:MAG: acyl-CoA dehydrogenase family protein [Pseudomonadales bacterium]
MTESYLGIEINEEMTVVHETVRRFSEEVIRPLGIELDKMHTPEQVIAADSPLWQGLEQYKELGLVGQQGAYGPDLSPAQRALLHCMVMEEMCAGDVGLNITYSLFNCAAMTARNFGNEDAALFFDDRDEICCLAITEPNHGTDQVAFTEPGHRNANIGIDCKVRRDGDDYIINGQKSSWVSTGTIAGAAILFASYEGSDKGAADGAVFVMPLDLPGISKGKPLDKIGQRSLNQGEIFFDNVRVPGKFMMMDGPDVYPMIWEFTLRDANIAMGQMFVGVARAAYEHALQYSKERVQGGVPIIQHQNVKSRLYGMFLKVEMARSHVRQVAISNATQEGGVPFQYATGAKLAATQAAFDVANDAIQSFGGYGLCREYPVEKLFRDARASLIEDGENSMLAIMAASRL